MNPTTPLPFRTFFLAALAGILSFLPHFSANAEIIDPPAETPAGDLTVTVEEQENGDVRFTLSGTAFMQDWHPGMSTINYNSGLPPSFTYGSFGLPEGLTITTPNNDSVGSEDPEEGALPILRDHPLIWIYFSGGWQLSGPFYTGPLYRGDPIIGSGSVTTSEINFDQYFVPGTFIVEPGGFAPDSEPEVAEGMTENTGIFPYFVTYNVIPFEYKPSLAVSAPGSFSKTLLGKSAGARKVTITNSGNATLTGLKLEITGPGSRDFSASGLPKKELAPGESTTVEVSFRPKRKGSRIATLTVTGLYTPRQEVSYAAEVEELPIEEVSPLPPVEVSASTRLSGKGVARPKAKPRPNTPRFPRAR
jgi:hypothetical protein